MRIAGKLACILQVKLPATCVFFKGGRVYFRRSACRVNAGKFNCFYKQNARNACKFLERLFYVQFGAFAGNLTVSENHQ